MFRYEYWGNRTLPVNTHMALEEFLLRRAAAQKTACVRFFSVPRDSIVLGYTQTWDVIKRLDGSFDVARRITGGSHVQIGPNTLAYSFVVPRDGSFRTCEDMRGYFARRVAQALEGLKLGEVEVDNRASTIQVNGQIIASHAIAWGPESALLHGLIMIRPYDVGKVAGRVSLGVRKVGNKFYPEAVALQNLATVSQTIPPKLARADLKKIVAEAILRKVTGGKFRVAKIGKRVIYEALELQRRRYERVAWIKSCQPALGEQIEKLPGEGLDGTLKRRTGYCLFSQVRDRDFKRMVQPSSV